MRHSLSMLACAITACALTTATAGAVTVPQWISLPHYTAFDGVHYGFRATDSGGTILPDGPYSMVFAIWDDETAGSMLWSEVQTVSVNDGLGSVQLGAVTPIPLDVFGTLGGDTTKSRFLEITLAGEVISPRTRLVSAPYANASERVLGDIETSDGHLRVSNIGSSGLDGVSIDLDALEDVGNVSIAPVGSAGADGAFIFVDPDSSSLELKNDFSYTTSKFKAGLTGGTLGVEVKKSNFKRAEITVAPDVDVEIKGSSLSLGGQLTGFTYNANEVNAHMSLSNTGGSSQSGHSAVAELDSIIQSSWHIGPSTTDSSTTIVGGGSVRRSASSTDGVSITKVIDKATTNLHQVVCTNEHNGLGKLSWYSHSTSAGEVYQKYYHLDLASGDSIGLSGSFDSTGGSWKVSRSSSGSESGVAIDIIPSDTTTFRVGRVTPAPVIRGFQTAVVEGGSTNAEFSDPSGSGGGGRVVVDCDASDASSSVTTIGAPAGDGVVSTATSSLVTQSVRVGGGAGGSIWLQAENFPQGGKIGVNNNSPVFEVDVVGSICATGGVGCPSDQRLKKNIRELTDALSIIAELRGVTFDWRTDEFPDKNLPAQTEVGFVAQEVREVLPEAVIEGTDGYLALDYGRLTPVLLQAIKQQQATISRLETKVSKVDRLAFQVAALSEKLDLLLAEKGDSQIAATVATAPRK